MVLSPLHRVDAHIHRKGLGQRVFTGELQVDALLTADEAFMGIHVALDGILVDEMGPIALRK